MKLKHPQGHINSYQGKHLLSSVNLHFHCSTRIPNISLKYHNKVNFSNLLQSDQIIITTLHHCLYTCKLKERKKLSNGFKCHNCYDPATKPHVILKLLNYLTDKGKKTPQKIYLEIND